MPVRFVIATVVAVALGLAVVFSPAAFALVVPAVASLGVIALVLRWTSVSGVLGQDVVRWTYGSFTLHLALSLAIASSNSTVTFFGPDANTYHYDAIAIVRHWSEGTPMPGIARGKEGFYLALARLYQVFGPHRVVGLVLISLCSALLVPLISDTTRRFVGQRAAQAVLPLIVLLPGFLVWTSQLLREAPILAGLALATNLAARLSERFTPGRIAILSLTVAVLFTLRANIAYVFAGGLLVGLALGGRHLVPGLVTAATVVGVVATILAGGVGGGGYELSTKANLKQVSHIRAAHATAAQSGVAPDADVSTASGSLAYLPIGIPQLLLGPFPWQVRNLRQAAGVMEAMTVWWLVPAFVRGLRRARRRLGRRLTLLVAPAVGVAVVLALLIGNSGTLVRERMQVMVLLLPVIALGWVRVEADAGKAEQVPGVPSRLGGQTR